MRASFSNEINPLSEVVPMPSSVTENTENVNSEIAFSCRADSFFLFRVDDEPWIWTPSYIVLPPPPEPDRGAVYSASLISDDYSEVVRQALRDRDDVAARHYIRVARAILDVALAKLTGELLS
jgi:hypothetical protein